MSFRAFIAVDVDRTSSMAEFHKDLMNIGPGLKPVDLGSVHITLKFLGETDESLVPKIGEAMERAVRGTPTFTIKMSKAGAFPSRPPIRVVWVGLKGAEPLAMMAKGLEEDLAAIGFSKEERPFSPHLTLARVKDPRASYAATKLVERFRDQEFGEQPINSIKLKRSVLSRAGPEYSTVLDVPLH
jgi:2'-5' RNA ligase